MIRYEEAKLALARALHALLTESDAQEWFSVSEISSKSGLSFKGAFASRVMALSLEEDDVFERYRDENDEFWTLAKEGFDLVETSEMLVIEMQGSAPAADRVVRFNHNSPDALEISAQLEEVGESVRGANGPEIDEQERSRVFASLEVAKQIWESGQFKLIQLRVGVLLAIEDAAALLSRTAKHVGAALLVDAIKAFAKNHFHADLDSL